MVLRTKLNDRSLIRNVAGHPRNNLLQEKTFLKVEKLENEDWKIVATDSNWETKFIWRRTQYVKGSSEAEIQWKINEDVAPGTYRIRHFGYYKYILGGIYPYEGKTKAFKVTS
ncbi:hypothetical protein JTB14_019768 [Gonioctena quinquepunctata]|nr:hypothetical protein JTB14_019768 [Gonioctena quinquepunctata]